MKYIYPLKEYTLKQDFGDDPAYYAQYGQKGHNGLDLGTTLKTSVRASRSGTVLFAGKGEGLYFVGSIAGNYVLIDHGDMWTGYAHNYSLSVKAGQKVKQGQEIAKAGRSGDASGVHVHFEFIPPASPVTNKNGYWGRVDPKKYLKENDMLTEEQLGDLRRSQTGKTATKSEIKKYVGKLNYKQMKAEIKTWPSYKSAKKRADTGKLDAVKHLPEALRTPMEKNA